MSHAEIGGVREGRRADRLAGGSGTGSGVLDDCREQSRRLLESLDAAIEKSLPIEQEEFASTYRQEVGQ